MNLKIYWINEPKIGPNRLGIMAHPQGHEQLNSAIKSLKVAEIDCLVSLLEKSEADGLGLHLEEENCNKYGIEFINLPINDFNTPKNVEKFIGLVHELTSRLNHNKKVVIHCQGGIGRSSILLAAIMIRLGFSSKNIFELIEKYRKLKVPETQEQKDWIFSIASRIIN